MRPVLFEVFGMPVWSYFFMLALGLSAGIVLGVKLAYEDGVDAQKFGTLARIVVIAALGGSRLMYVVESWPHMRDDPVGILRFWNGGLSFFGGLVAAIVFGVAYVVHAGLPLWKVCDLSVIGVVLGHVLGKSGCFLNGCCAGRLISSGNPERYPAQMAEVLLLAVLFGILWILRRRRLRPGMVFGAYLVGYGVVRFGLEFIREQAGVIETPFMWLYQWVAFGCVVCGAIVLAWVIRVRSSRG